MAVETSVIIPVHDQAGLLPAALRSVLAQRYADFEVIVCGDGCTDDSERVTREVGDGRVRWLPFAKGPGFGYGNRGRAVARAEGRLVAYLAPDDLWAPDHLTRLVAGRRAGGFDLVFSRPVLVWAGGPPRPHYLPFDVAAHGAVAPVGPRLYCLSPTQVLHTRDIHDRAGGWDDRVPRHGDVDLWLRCRAAGARIGYVPRPTLLRFPSYAFRAVSPDVRRALHQRMQRDLESGALDLADLGWSGGRRLLGWLTEAAVVGRARGPGFARAWLRMRRAGP